MTVHLHYASRRHYEYTDIPKVNLFLFFRNNLAILFTCVFFSNSVLHLLLHMPTEELLASDDQELNHHD